MLPPSTDNRRKTRLKVEQLITVKDALLDSPVGQIVNLNEYGFMLIGGGDIREECLYQLEFLFATPVDNASHIAVGAECLWLKETDGCDQYWAGFHIIDISDSDRHVLMEVMQQL